MREYYDEEGDYYDLLEGWDETPWWDKGLFFVFLLAIVILVCVIEVISKARWMLSRKQ